MSGSLIGGFVFFPHTRHCCIALENSLLMLGNQIAAALARQRSIPSLAHARLSLSVRRESKLYTMFRASLPRNPWRVNWFIYRSDVMWLVNTHQASYVEGLGGGCCRVLSRAPDSPALGRKPQYVTAVDKPINTPRISLQACTKLVYSLTRLSP